ncbi:carboxypeptidase-like regulatory domain-containing protein [Mongoliitalea daihaiensis]|uniref:carboxypeptidase-like regulatory domain-containing protein n=1 Tax=Mongoliitalea daihaiensis TaxID=2782006 RepID=UPI001F40045C|nr:carboxypeptidase-like regulatory domain-containing protein [Mongoliitalea daihaiensis]UJP64250.1 carboxypeptidase-like regulatory domain-containing protein [Mongoliitalea daihaiensis]
MNTLIRLQGTLFLTICLLYSPILSYAQNFVISGTLKNGLTEDPISNATVTIRETAFYAVSRESGKFEITNVFAGKFVMQIMVPGFETYLNQINVKNDLDLGTIFLYPYGREEKSGDVLQKTIRATNVAQLFATRPNLVGGNSVFGIPPEPKQLIGDYYLDGNWNKASILLYKNAEVIEGYLVRYQINSNNFEIRAEDSDEISTIPGLRIQNLVWVDNEFNIPRFFVNGMDFKDEGSPISGFFEVLVDGKKPLLRRTIATIRESNYNEALMVGERDDKIVKRNQYYYAVGKNIFIIPKKKKQFLEIFGEQSDMIAEFIQKNKINFKEPSALYSIFTHYNSQFEDFEPIGNQLMLN